MAGKRVRSRGDLVRIALFCFLAFVLVASGFSWILPQSDQTSESFYLNLLNEGEQSYLAGDYREAVKKLEIAVFGLFRQKNSVSKAYVYMSICYHHLDDQENARLSLSETLRWLSKEEIKALDLNLSESDREILGNMLSEPEEIAAPEQKMTEQKTDEKKTVTLPETTPPEKVSQKKPEEKKSPGSVEERIAQLIEQRKLQKKEGPKDKEEVPAKKDPTQKAAESKETKESQIEGIEELFMAEESSPDNILTEVWIKKGAGSLDVEILFKPYNSHRVFEIADPLPKRIVIDIDNITGINAERSVEVKDFGIASIRTGMFKSNTARVVFDAEGELPNYSVEKTESGLKIVIRKPVD